jgi:ribonuclease T1
MPRNWVRLLGLALLLCLPQLAHARHHSASGNDAPLVLVNVAELPPEARDTLQRIRNGGPFPFPRDGIVFSNYQRRLPPKPRGHYHEYTVKTPGIGTRGARRIVCGEFPECYYSNDHYQSFRRIKE